MGGMLNEQAAQAAAQEEPVEPTEEPVEDPQAAAEEQVPQEAPPAPGQPDPRAQEQEPTPEEQEAFTRLEIAAKKVIHDKKESFDNIVEILKAGKDNPVESLAQAALIVFGVLDNATKGGVPEVLILRGAEVCLDLVIDLAEKTGIMQVDENMANQAMISLVKQAGVMYDFETGDMEEQMLNALNSQQGQPAAADPQAQEQQAAAAPAQPAAPEPGVM